MFRNQHFGRQFSNSYFRHDFSAPHRFSTKYRPVPPSQLPNPSQNVDKGQKEEQIQELKVLQQKISTLQVQISNLKKNIELKKKQSVERSVQKNKKGKEQSKLSAYLTQFNKRVSTDNLFKVDCYLDNDSIYYISEMVRAVLYQPKLMLARDHIFQTLQYLIQLKGIVRPPQQQIPTFTTPQESSCQGKITVVFDLDQTLIHCNQNISMPHDLAVDIVFPGGQVATAGINIRPFLKETLEFLSEKFQLILFTAGHSCYADKVIDIIDQKRVIFKHRLYREHCYQTKQGFYIKDLRVLGRDLKQTVLVDNAVYSYFFQQQNGIPIIPYYQGKSDCQLDRLKSYLLSLQGLKDVRERLRQDFRLQEFESFTDPVKLVKTLFPKWVEKFKN